MSTALTQQRAVEIAEQQGFHVLFQKELHAAMEQYHREASARCPDCGETSPAEIHTCSPQKPDSDEGLRRMLDLVNETDSARWEIGFRNIVSVLYGPRHRFEIADVVERVRDLAQSAPQPDRVASAAQQASVEPIAIIHIEDGVARIDWYYPPIDDGQLAVYAAPPDAEAPRKKVAAQDLLIKSLEAQRSELRAQQATWREAVVTLESERAANAALTAEIERLREFVEEVRRSGDTRLASMAIAAIAARKEG